MVRGIADLLAVKWAQTACEKQI